MSEGPGDGPAAGRRPLLVASNRGPVAFELDRDGTPVGSRGAGGLASSLADVVRAVGGRWVASALSDGDRARAAADPEGFEAEGLHLRYLTFEPDRFDGYYNEIANRVLWFCHHALWDVPRTPSFGPEFAGSWAAYREVNAAFAEALADAAGDADPAFLVQDYHLCLVPRLLRERRPDARISHFSHIPFAGPVYISILPDAMRLELLEGLLGADVVGFHTVGWARNFLEACRGLPGARVDGRRRRVRWQGRDVGVEVNPISVDAASLRGQAEAVDPDRRARVRAGAEPLIFRADRMELSKNVVRGFAAYERLLEAHPEWRRRARFLAHIYPSRQAVPEYAEYAEECRASADRVNDRFGDDGWAPVELVIRDEFEEVLAAYLEYDVLLVNPVFDGMNLVAKEGPVVNERDGVLVLSRNAGAFDELGRHALGVNPFDVEETAEALHAALSMPSAERRRRARGLRAAIESRTPKQWAEAQLRVLER